MLACESPLKICPSDEVSGNTAGSVEVEVPGHDNGCARFVVISIFKALLKLGAAQIVTAAALKVPWQPKVGKCANVGGAPSTHRDVTDSG
jgi:hypothetical protein